MLSSHYLVTGGGWQAAGAVCATCMDDDAPGSASGRALVFMLAIRASTEAINYFAPFLPPPPPAPTKKKQPDTSDTGQSPAQS